MRGQKAWCRDSSYVHLNFITYFYSVNLSTDYADASTEINFLWVISIAKNLYEADAGVSLPYGIGRSK